MLHFFDVKSNTVNESILYLLAFSNFRNFNTNTQPKKNNAHENFSTLNLLHQWDIIMYLKLFRNTIIS